MLGNKTKLQSLIAKSENIFSVFEKTKKEITIVNDEIAKEVNDRRDKINLLNYEANLLNEQIVKNNKVLVNIDKFFE